MIFKSSFRTIRSYLAFDDICLALITCKFATNLRNIFLTTMEPSQSAKLIETLEKVNQTLQQNSIGSSAADVILSIVPVAGIAFGWTLLFFFFLWQYRLKKELIRTNQYESSTFWKNIRTLSLLIGCLSTMIGIPITVLFFIIHGASAIALGGLIPIAVGVGLLTFYIFSRKRNEG